MLLHIVPFVLAMAGQTAPPQQAPPPPVPAATVRVAQPVARPKTYNETADAKAQIAAAIQAAALDDIRVFINWGANDDDNCQKFSKTPQGRPENGRPFFSDEYKVVNVDVGHLDKNLDLAETYGVPLATGALPVLTILDGTGKALANAPASQFVSDTDPAAFDSGKIAAFLTEHEAPVPDANASFQAALDEASRDGKSVMVWFSAPW